MYRHILICTDGSEVAGRGLEHGLDLAVAIGAQATIITVTERFPIYSDGVYAQAISGPMIAEMLASQEQGATAILKDAKALADQRGLTVETLHAPNAQPAEAIVEAAASRGCDLIVMASHGRRGLGRLMLGSETAEVVARSAVPVLVVR